MTKDPNIKNIIVGISGASGALYGINLLKKLKTIKGVRTHLIITKSAHITINYETDNSIKEIIELADYHYNINDIACVISSGSFVTHGMIIAPCSVKTLAAIASGNCSNILTQQQMSY